MIIKNKSEMDTLSNPDLSRSPSTSEPPPPSYDDVTNSSSSIQLVAARRPDVIPRINIHAASTNDLRALAASRQHLPPVPTHESERNQKKSLQEMPSNHYTVASESDLQVMPTSGNNWQTGTPRNLDTPENHLQMVSRYNMHAASMSNLREVSGSSSVGDFHAGRRNSDVAPPRSSAEGMRERDLGMGYTRNWTVARRDPMSRSNSAPENRASIVDKIKLEHHEQDIRGTYYINPRPKKKILGVMTVNEETQSRLTTRKGTVDLQLSIGGGEEFSDTVDLLSGSREGDVTINITSITEGTRLHLEAHSMEGHVQLYLPSTYSGYVRISTQSGSLNVLEGIGALSHIERATDKKQVLRFGEAKKHGNTNSMNYCKIHSRRAAVVIGVFGLDHFVPPEKVKRKWYSIG